MCQQHNSAAEQGQAQPKHQALLEYDYHMWATDKVFDRLKELRDEVYRIKMESTFSCVAEVMSHILLADRVWLGVMSDTASMRSRIRPAAA
ncbi:DinB family protein [Paenibacillus xerothermodurans]|uniref:DinB family protein n=1 Tax=Paenibacillus xerothermodurans TaxID=1977292 RepID=A0A2W1N4G3_PAEXE|nr:DinB family protein [Paenibacillus xerothermodurans]PZE19247.1 hypothetical protein CBW46_019360 [Paenibacillus xerothermodurans]